MAGRARQILKLEDIEDGVTPSEKIIRSFTNMQKQILFWKEIVTSTLRPTYMWLVDRPPAQAGRWDKVVILN